MSAFITILLFILINSVFGFFAAWLAIDKGRSPVNWFFLALFFNFIALITLVGSSTLTEDKRREMRRRQEHRRAEAQWPPRGWRFGDPEP